MAARFAPHHVVRSLWAVLLLAAVAVVALLAYRLLPLLPVAGKTTLAMAGLPSASDSAPAPPPAVERNPFDPSGAAWQTGPAAETPRPAGALKGVIVLPGVRRVLTDAGLAKVGETTADGRIVTIGNRQIVVDQAGKSRPLAPPGAQHPKFNELNRAAATRAPRPENP